MTNRLLVILGAGPGVGMATALHFASKGFDVALLSRSIERLAKDVATVQEASPNVRAQAFTVDVGDPVALKKALEKVEVELGVPEVVYYNAARVRPSKIGETSPEYILDDFKV